MAFVSIALLVITLVPRPAAARRPYCHLRNMVLVGGAFCIDQYESVTQVKKRGRWVYHSPFESVKGKEVRAVSRPGRFPQAYISRNEAAAACAKSNKRLCKESEWKKACKGKTPHPVSLRQDAQALDAVTTTGSPRSTTTTGTRKGPPLSAYGWGPMNDPKLNQLRGTLAKTGRFSRCRNSYRLHDMVGNLHEWVDNPGGTFLGGYYLDTQINGEGCDYKTVAHNAAYHDYSTGFRCCADPR